MKLFLIKVGNLCFDQGNHELTEISRDFRKLLKLLAESYAVLLHANQGMHVCNGSIGQFYYHNSTDRPFD